MTVADGSGLDTRVRTRSSTISSRPERSQLSTELASVLGVANETVTTDTVQLARSFSVSRLTRSASGTAPPMYGGHPSSR
jgi:hypothetical protein